MEIVNSRVSGNTSEGQGAGIAAPRGVLRLTNSTVSGNTNNSNGGGIYLEAGGSDRPELILVNSTVSGNVARLGGGIMNETEGTLTVIGSTISGNQATAYYGAGIYHAFGSLKLTNSTVSSNSATAGGGAGIHVQRGGTAVIANTTVSSNLGGDASVVATDQGTVSLRNSAIDGDCSGAATSIGHNIESPGNTCGFNQTTDQPGVTAGELNLGLLADNGGPTMTHALGAGSVAIDQIPGADCVDADGAPLTTDQRGLSRPAGSGCDVGAFEVQP